MLVLQYLRKECCGLRVVGGLEKNTEYLFYVRNDGSDKIDESVCWSWRVAWIRLWEGHCLLTI